MFIQTEETPNPATLKFLPGVSVMQTGTAEFSDAACAAHSPLAEKIFTLEGIKDVFFGHNFISVTKDHNSDWHHLKTPILGFIMDHFTMGMPLLKDTYRTAPKASNFDDAITNQIIELLDTRVRPAVAQDGGDIEFHDYSEGVVFLRMRGACAGCPSSEATLKMGIENMLKHFVPEVREVRAVN
jgi:Fe-S cluster biogenesis protein NfuA